MARCVNCGKLMLFGSKTGYCAACEPRFGVKRKPGSGADQPAAKPVQPEADAVRPAAEAKDPGPVRGDGIYCLAAKRENGEISYFMCLRFYPGDGTVITGSFSGLPLESVFNRENSSFHRNPYTLRGNSIRFGAVSDRGVVDYNGTIDENKVVADTLSHINGHAASRQVFVFLTDEQVVQLRKKGC